MKNLIVLFLIPLFAFACNGQIRNTEDKTESISSDSIQPKTEFKVNKVYDENGNLIRYDSTYFWSYTNSFGDSVYLDIDSVMSEFRPFMNKRLPGFYPQFNQDHFLVDSTFYQDFMNPHYYFDRWNRDLEMMNEMMQRMDSLKSQFFFDYYPDINQKKE